MEVPTVNTGGKAVSSASGAGDTEFTFEKNETRLYLSHCTKTISKWIKYFDISPKMLKLL